MACRDVNAHPAQNKLAKPEKNERLVSSVSDSASALPRVNLQPIRAHRCSKKNKKTQVTDVLCWEKITLDKYTHATSARIKVYFFFSLPPSLLWGCFAAQ